MTVPSPAHRTALARWGTLSLMEQMAHVGSEVERCLNAVEARRADRLQHALDRALELFDATAADARWRGPRRREILRARELFCGLLGEEDVAQGSVEGYRRYFLAFAVAARNPRRR